MLHVCLEALQTERDRISIVALHHANPGVTKTAGRAYYTVNQSWHYSTPNGGSCHHVLTKMTLCSNSNGYPQVVGQHEVDFWWIATRRKRPSTVGWLGPRPAQSLVYRQDRRHWRGCNLQRYKYSRNFHIRSHVQMQDMTISLIPEISRPSQELINVGVGFDFDMMPFFSTPMILYVQQRRCIFQFVKNRHQGGMFQWLVMMVRDARACETIRIPRRARLAASAYSGQCRRLEDMQLWSLVLGRQRKRVVGGVLACHHGVVMIMCKRWFWEWYLVKVSLSLPHRVNR